MQRRRILLVEDHIDNREVLTLALEAARLDVTAVSSVPDGVALLEARAFELVITDLGVESQVADAAWLGFRRLRAAAHPAPVGVISGLTPAESRASGEGAAFFLAKPFALSTLFAELTRIFAVPLPDGVRETVDAYLRTLEAGAWDDLLALCTEDVVYRLPGSVPGLSTTVRGRAELRRLAEETFRAFPDPAFTVEDIHPLPDAVVVDYVGTWRDGTQRRSAPGTILFQFRDGLISEINIRADVVALTGGEPK